MGFLEPSALAWAGVLAGVIALYLFRRRPRKLLVSALAFYKTLSAAHQESAWLRFLKKLLAFLMSAALVAFAVGWLARVTFSPGQGDYKTVILLVDRSASLAARPEPGKPDRFAAGMDLLRRKLSGLSESTGIVVIAYDARPEILLGRSLDRHAVEAALAGVRPLPVAGDPERALALAQALAAAGKPAVIWHLTDSTILPHDAPASGVASDGAAAGATEATPGVAAPKEDAGVAKEAGLAEVVPVAAPLPKAKNAGITAFHLRRLPLEHDRYEAFVQIEGVCDQPEDAELEIRMDDRLAGIRKIPIKTGGKERLILPFAAAECKKLRLILRLPGDMLSFDDAVSVPVPGSWPVHVSWVSPVEEPYTELALRALASAGMEISYLKPAQWPPKELPDVVIFENMAPPTNTPACPAILLNPQGGYRGFPVVPLANKGTPAEHFRVTDEAHPVLYGVANERLALTQTAVLSSNNALEPLWVSPAGALLCAGELEGKRTVVLGFSPLTSERLVLTPSYPLLLGNAIYWTTEEARHAAEGRHLKTGSLLQVKDATLSWTDAVVPAPEGVKPVGGWLTLNGVGAWKTSDGQIGSASLLSPEETVLQTTEGTDDKLLVAGMPNLRRMLLWAALALLLLEFWLYHRHAVY